MGSSNGIHREKRKAYREYREAKEKWVALGDQIKVETNPQRIRELGKKRRQARKRLDAKCKAWHLAVEMAKAAKMTKADKKRGPKELGHPATDEFGFEFVKRHKDFYRHVIDPSWCPPRSQCRMLGKYVFWTLHEPRDGVWNTQAIVTVQANGHSEEEIRGVLTKYFAQDEAQVYFGRVRVLDLQRRTRPRQRKMVDVTISTDHRSIRGFIRD